jgi:hypothetical protein
LIAGLLGVLGSCWIGGDGAVVAKAGDQKDELLSRADEIAKTVSKLRGLPIQSPIRRGVMNKAQILERLQARVKQEYRADEIRGEELALKRLGLLPADADYLALVLKVMTDQIAGFYDPMEKQLYIADWEVLARDFVMAHEIDHALQDQKFELQQFLRAVHNNNDALLARQALIEGDGMALGLEFTFASLGRQVPWGQEGFIEQFRKNNELSRATLKGVPLIMRELLLFPYTYGLEFVGYYRKQQPWSRVDQIFAKPPLSTEQILHTDVYDAYEKPIEITAGKLSDKVEYRVAYDNVVGELGLELLLRQHGVSETTAQIAARGWGGDRLVLYTPPGYQKGIGGLLGVLFTAWDEEPDAIEFYGALEQAMSSLTEGVEVDKREGRVQYRTNRGEVAVLERRAERVVLIIGAPPAQAAEMGSAVWRDWKVQLPTK